MRHTVLLFGPQAKLAEAKELVVDVDAPATAADVIAAIVVACPELAESMSVSRLAVNHEFAAPGTIVAEGDELALIGMVSGG